jgi:hypothetical protein
VGRLQSAEQGSLYELKAGQRRRQMTDGRAVLGVESRKQESVRGRVKWAECVRWQTAEVGAEG